MSGVIGRRGCVRRRAPAEPAGTAGCGGGAVRVGVTQQVRVMRQLVLGEEVGKHDEAEDGQGRPVFALPSQRFGPELTVHTDLPRPGLYRLWGQFRDADGRVLTTTFTVRAE